MERLDEGIVGLLQVQPRLCHHTARGQQGPVRPGRLRAASPLPPPEIQVPWLQLAPDCPSLPDNTAGVWQAPRVGTRVPSCCWHTVTLGMSLHQAGEAPRSRVLGDNGNGAGTALGAGYYQGDLAACGDTSEHKHSISSNRVCPPEATVASGTLRSGPHPLRAKGELPSLRLARVLTTVYERIRSWLPLTSC